jgi:hypothetical protein
MIQAFGISAALVFFLASVLHFYWVARGASSKVSGVLPSSGGQAAFRPSRLLTLLVAIALLACGLLFLGKLGYLGSAIPVHYFETALGLLAAILILRSIGDFRLVGLFKKVRGTPFSRMDTRVYVPLCMVLAVCSVVVATGHVA